MNIPINITNKCIKNYIIFNKMIKKMKLFKVKNKMKMRQMNKLMRRLYEK